MTHNEEGFVQMWHSLNVKPGTKPIEKLKYRIYSVAQQITFSPEPQPNNEPGVDAYKAKQHMHKTPCCVLCFVPE
jgi:hypothetical protein